MWMPLAKYTFIPGTISRIILTRGTVEIEERPGTTINITDVRILTLSEFKSIRNIDFVPHGLSWARIRREAAVGNATAIAFFYYVRTLETRLGPLFSRTNFIKATGR